MKQSVSFSSGTLTSWLLAILLAFAVAAPVKAQGVQEDPLLDTLHKFRIQNFMALNLYYNYSVEPDRHVLNELNHALDLSRSLMSQIEDDAAAADAETALDADRVSRLRSNFNDFLDQMEINVTDMQEQGFPDLRLLSEMANQAHALSLQSEAIYRDVVGLDEIESDSDIELARRASITMALMVTKYSARTSSTVQQTFQGADTDRSIDELAEEFDRFLADLRSRMQGTDAQGTMATINSKWNFIRDSYYNYNERTVSFVINRYSSSIIEGLEDVIGMIQEA